MSVENCFLQPDKITPEDAAKRDAKEVADEFRDEIGKRISELTHDISTEIATLRAAVEKAEWERDDAIATIKLLQQQLKIQNDSFVDRIDEIVAALEVTASMYERATGLPMPPQAYRAIVRWLAEKK